MDLSQVHVGENPQKLNGEWEFYWQELLMPEDLQRRVEQGEPADRYIHIPGSWLGYQIDDQRLSGTGYATFRLAVRLGEQDRSEHLALRLPTIFHAYKLWVNGELLAEAGAVGTDRSSVIPRLESKLVFFQQSGETLELVMQVANFHHQRGGITKFIELGGSDVLAARTKLMIAAEVFATACMLIIGIYHLMLFALRRKDRAPLYFGLLSLLVGIRSMMVGDHLLTLLWPAFPWEWQFKIEYLILCGSSYIMTLYYDSLFPNYVSRRFFLGSRIVTGVLCIIVALTPAIIYTKLLLAIGIVVVLHMVYLIAGLIRAAARRKEGALLFLVLAVVVLVIIINDFLYYNEWSPVGNIFPLGMLVFTVAQMFLLSQRFARAASNEEKIARELQEANRKLTEMNMNLERIVQERTQALSVAHEDLRASYERLLQSEEGRKKLLSYITHDLRMPLASMLGSVEAVLDNVKPERNEQYLKYIRENTIRVNRMIEDLSYLSHLETGQVPFRLKPVPVAGFLRDFYDQYELVVHDAGLDFTLNLGDWEDEGRDPPVVMMDRERLEQALSNIVSNAVKFTPSGGSVQIALEVDEGNEPRHAVISVQDTGTGIPPEQLELIFERHYKAVHPSAEKAAQGSGLGLAICREIVQAHGGTVRAESDGRTMSIFRISLPCIPNESR